MQSTPRPVWFQVTCACMTALVCVVAGANVADALVYGLPGGARIGRALADLTWWDVLFYGPQ